MPLLCRLLLRLDALGCPRAVITAGYLADILRGGVEDFLKSAPRSPRLSVDFFTEDSPLGTAGSVKAAYNALLSPEKAFRRKAPLRETRSPGTPPDGARTFLILGGTLILRTKPSLRPPLLCTEEKTPR